MILSPDTKHSFTQTEHTKSPTVTANGPYYVGLDIGGTKVLGAITNTSGRTLAVASEPTISGNEGVLLQAGRVIDSLLLAVQGSVGDLIGVGVGIPGVVETNTGTVRNAVNLGVSELPLALELQADLDCPVYVDNDVNVAAIGAASRFEDADLVAYLNIGTGMAGCLVQDGRAFTGTSGAAGEIGHLPVDPRGLACPCGQVGCLETIASGSAIERRWTSTGEHTSDDLLAAHLAGNAAATEVFLQFADGVAQAVRALVLAYDPTYVVIGGGMRKLGEPLFDAMDGVFTAWGDASPFVKSLDLSGRVQVLPADAEVGAVGATLLASRPGASPEPI